MSGVQIYYNLIHDNACGIEFYGMNNSITNCKIYNNVIYNNSSTVWIGSVLQLVWFWYSNPEHRSNTVQVDIKNNIIAQNYHNGAGDRQIYTYGNGNTIDNQQQ